VLTPFEVKDKVREIHKAASFGGELKHFHARKLREELYRTVLREIAQGSVDPRSLAIAALEAEEEQ
jgi:hypothetical protein